MDMDSLPEGHTRRSGGCLPGARPGASPLLGLLLVALYALVPHPDPAWAQDTLPQKIKTIELGSAAHYEEKYKGPEGIVVDLGHWVGTAPIDEKREESDEAKSQPAPPVV